MLNSYFEGSLHPKSKKTGENISAPPYVKTNILDSPYQHTRQRLSSVIDIIHFLDQGNSISDLPSAVKDIQAISIAHMLNNLFEKKIIPRQKYSPYQVMRVISDNISFYKCPKVVPNADPGPTRMLCLGALQKGQLIPPRAPLRSLRPIGSTPTIPEVGRLVEKATGISFKNEVCSKKRGQLIIDARFQVIYVLRVVCGFSLTMIGQSLDGRDHTTILSGLNKINIKRATDEAVRESTDRMCETADLAGFKRALKRLQKSTAAQNAPDKPRRLYVSGTV